MDIIRKMSIKAKNNAQAEGVTIAFIGDSVTQGCFEIYRKNDNSIETIFDKKHAYHTYVADILATLFPTVPVNIINAGISGDNAPSGLMRLERDVLRHEPDLVIVCYGLNDAGTDSDSLSRYIDALRKIFNKLKQSHTEIIFMTPNMMNTRISDHLQDENMRAIAEDTRMVQTNGYFDAHINAARELCHECGIRICDCYSIWKRMYESGVDTTELLANKINHPTREMNFLFAYELVRTMVLE